MTGIIYQGKRQFKRAIPACHGQKPWARHGQRKLAATVEEIDKILASNKEFEDKINDFDTHFSSQITSLQKNLQESLSHISSSSQSIKELQDINSLSEEQLEKVTQSIKNIELGI